MSKKLNPIAVRFSYEEERSIKKAAQDSGLSVSEYIRGKVFARPQTGQSAVGSWGISQQPRPGSDIDSRLSLDRCREAGDACPQLEELKKALEKSGVIFGL